MPPNTLDPPARKLVEATRLAGRPIPLEVAAALIDATREEALAIGERLIQAGLIDTSETASLQPETTSRPR